MLVDPVTVIAQIINFLLLVVALKVVLYDRVIDAMDRREQRIADRLSQADAAKREANHQAQHLRSQREQLDRQRDQLLTDAREQAAREKEEYTRQARAEVEELQQRWRRSLKEQQDRLIDELQRRAGQEICHISRRVLRDLADAELEHQAVTIALRKLSNTGDLGAFLSAATSQVEVRTAFPLDDEQRTAVTSLLQTSDVQPAVAMVTDTDLICGLELRSHGQALGWTVAGHLDDLTEEISQVLPTRQPAASESRTHP